MEEQVRPLVSATENTKSSHKYEPALSVLMDKTITNIDNSSESTKPVWQEEWLTGP